MDAYNITYLNSAADAAALLGGAKDLPLHLPSLAKITAEAASVLATHNYGIVMSGLTSIDAAVAEALMPHKWGLHLLGLRGVARAAGDCLAQHVGPVTLRNELLAYLESPLLAARLAKDSSWSLSLDSLQSLQSDVAGSLVRGVPTDVQPALSLSSLRFLTPEAATELCRRLSRLSLSGLSSKSCVLIDGAEAVLASFHGILDVGGGNGVSAMFRGNYSDAFLKMLVRSLVDMHMDDSFPHVLDLDHLSSLTTGQALALTELGDNGIAWLSGLEHIPPDIIDILVEVPGRVFVDPKVLDSVSLACKLAEQDEEYLDCGETETYSCREISPDAAAALVSSGADLEFPNLTYLSPELAMAFSSAAGSLRFDSITQLSAEAAGALADHGNSLHLGGIDVLSASIAEQLIQHSGSISLRRVGVVTTDAAELLAQDDGDCPKITIAELVSAPPEAMEILRQSQCLRPSAE
jgi:hypothetical protein